MKRQAKDIISSIVVILLIIIAIGAIGSLYSGGDTVETPNREEHTSRVIIDSETTTEIPDESTNAEETETDDGSIHFPPMDF